MNIRKNGNNANNKYASLNEIDLEGFGFGLSPYSIDYTNMKVEIDKTTSGIHFINNCKLGGLYAASIESTASSDNVISGDFLVIKCGDAEFKYEIKMK